MKGRSSKDLVPGKKEITKAKRLGAVVSEWKESLTTWQPSRGSTVSGSNLSSTWAFGRGKSPWLAPTDIFLLDVGLHI